MITTTAKSSATPGTGTAQEVLVDQSWLAAHLDDPRVRVVEVDVSPAAYNDWHIDGAVLWNIYSDLKDADYHLAGTAELEQLITRSGINPDSTVVFYGYGPALGFWLMRLYGHQDVRILNCSRDTWRSQGHPWSAATTQPAAGSVRFSDEDLRIRADREAVLDSIGQQGTTLVDVRSGAEFDGERFWPSGGMQPDGRAGHIPTAVHQPIDGLYADDGSFRPAAELRAIFSAIDLDGTDELVTYCTIGGRAATAWFVLSYLLGRERVCVYEGSWAEWGRVPGAPVE
jgi:thiosulfate/3-mercaptopyruvate sulfurtransferase